jgi:DNA-binding transcriptional LysR family regulator
MENESMVEVRQARYFLAVADTLHFGRAAQQLAMSQPPLSQAILKLERQLGVRLLDRSGRRVTLTEAGLSFATHCRTLVAAAADAEQVVARTAAGMVGTLRIGLVTSALSGQFHRTLSNFRQDHPLVDLRISEVDTPAGLDAVLRRELDLAIVRPAVPVRGLQIRPWRHDEFVLALPAEHPLGTSASSSIDLALAAEEQWVWLRRDASPGYHDQLAAICHEAGFSPDVRHVANSIFTQLAMVASGLGVTLVPSVCVEQFHPRIEHRRLLRRTEIVELSIVARAGPLAPLVEAFWRTEPTATTTMAMPDRR